MISDSAHDLRTLERVLGGARVVVEELGTSELARGLARQLAQSLSAELAVVAVTDEQALVEVQCFRHGQGHVEAAELPAGVSNLLLWAAQRRQPFAAQGPEAPLPLGGDTLGSLGWRQALAVPALNPQGRAVAVLLAVNRRNGPLFSATDQRTAEILALQATVGFERALLLERLADWSTGLEALLAFSASVNQHLDPPALVRHLVEHAARFLKASGGQAGLLAEGSLISEGIWFGGTWIAERRIFRPGQSLPGFVLANEFPYLVNDYPSDKLADPELVRRFDVHRALAIPIRSSEGQVLGFFELHRGAAHPPFSWQDAAFLESLANTTAVAIENAQLLSALAAKNQQIGVLSAHNLERLEDERRHIARELHDEAGQALVGVKLGLQVMSRLVPTELPALRDQLDQLRDQVNAATTQLKDLAQRLRPPTLDQLGLAVALRQIANEYALRAGFEVELALTELPQRLSAMHETALFRLAQEALTNVAAHAQATEVRLSLCDHEDRVELEVEDNGRGFEPARESGLGLLGMRERVNILGGIFRLTSTPGTGTKVWISVPWEVRLE